MNIETAWKEFHTSLLTYVRKRVNIEQDAEDLVSGIYLKLVDNPTLLKNVENPKAWLFRITNNALIDHYRKKKFVNTDKYDIASDEPDMIDQLASEQLQECMLYLLKTLPEDGRTALLTTQLAGTPDKEYAKQSGISLSTAKARIRRSKLKLKSLLNKCLAGELSSTCGTADDLQCGCSYC